MVNLEDVCQVLEGIDRQSQVLTASWWSVEIDTVGQCDVRYPEDIFPEIQYEQSAVEYQDKYPAGLMA